MVLIESMVIVLTCLNACMIGVIAFLFFKIKILEKMLSETLKAIGKLSGLFSKFPTPEQLAKEVLKVKLPLSEAPPEVLAQMKTEIDNMNTKPPKSVKENYFG